MENITLGYWIWLPVFGSVIGMLAGRIVKGRGFGVLGDIVVGAVGGVFGGWIACVLGFYACSSYAAFAIALGGAVVLVDWMHYIAVTA